MKPFHGNQRNQNTKYEFSVANSIGSVRKATMFTINCFI